MPNQNDPLFHSCSVGQSHAAAACVSSLTFVSLSGASGAGPGQGSGRCNETSSTALRAMSRPLSSTLPAEQSIFYCCVISH